ncbi:MAG TPA: hypothetical protein VJM80_13410 [bacterium]|nr:hypothetical protein [bacterium]
MLAMDIGRNYARSYISRADRIDLERVNRLYQEMEQEALDAFRSTGVSPEQVMFSRTADMRYIGQFHEVEVEVAGGRLGAEDMQKALENFHRKHENLYTFKMHWKGAEFLTFRLRATAAKAPFQLREIGSGGEDASGALKRRRTCWFQGREVDTPVYGGDKLSAGNRIAGPAIIEETATTVVIPAFFTCYVDRWKNYALTRQSKP